MVTEALDLARQLPDEQQQEAVAALIGLGHRFLTESALNAVVEGLMSTSLGQHLLERGIEQGIQLWVRLG